MDANTINLVISLVSGLVGGNLAGAATSGDKNLGTLGNSVTGLVGGGLGGWILKALGVFATTAIATQSGTEAAAAALNSIDLPTVLANIGGSGVGGALLTLIAGYLKSSFQK